MRVDVKDSLFCFSVSPDLFLVRVSASLLNMEIKILPLLLNFHRTSLTPNKSFHIITGGSIVHNDNALSLLHLL
jgi:hypothetical protein